MVLAEQKSTQLQSRPAVRNTGLDLMRIVSMLMVLVLHYLSKGKVIFLAEPLTLPWIGAWGLESVCFCAVNCYVIASAYFLSGREGSVKPVKVVRLIATMWFYSWPIAAVLLATGMCTFSHTELFKSFMPFLSNSYWFVNTYILMYLLHPFMNKLIAALSDKAFKRLVLILLFFFCVLCTFLPAKYMQDTTKGYGIIWFVTLYFVTAYIRKYEISVKKMTAVLLFIGGAILCLGSICAVAYIYIKTGRAKSYAMQLYQYNNIPLLMMGFGLFNLFKDIRFNNRFLTKLITVCAGASLGVYLLHEQPKLREILWTDILKTPNYLTPKYFFIHIACCVIGVFAAGILIDLIRQRLFALIEKPLLPKVKSMIQKRRDKT